MVQLEEACGPRLVEDENAVNEAKDRVVAVAQLPGDVPQRNASFTLSSIRASRERPTCGKHATDRWADRVLNDLLEVPYHHLILAVPAHLRSECQRSP